jgi:hypothetical protein
MPPPGFAPRFPPPPHARAPAHWHNQEMHPHPPRTQVESPMRTQALAGGGGETLSRSGSQSSLLTPDRVPQSPIHSPHNSQPLNGAGMGVQSPTFPRPVHQMELDAALMLRDYISMQFGNQDTADTVVELTEMNRTKPATVLPAHSLLLAQSPTLLAMLAQNSVTAGPDTKRLVRITARDKFLLAPAFVEVLNHLYGAPLLNVHELVHGLRPFRLDDPETTAIVLQNMTRSLAHAATGYFLDMPAVTSNAMECAKRLLRWDTVERALSFALDGGLTPSWQSRSRSLSSYDRQRAANDTSDRRISLPTYGEYSGQFLQSIVDFLAYNFPKSFQFFPGAPQLLENPRLPTVLDSRPSISDPRLSRIQFGEMSAELSGRPDFVTTTLSSILISIPFPVLKVLVEHSGVSSRIGWSKVADIMHLVIRERESRRQKVLASKRIAASPDAALMENTGWWERVEESRQHGSGFVLVCSLLSAENGTATSADSSTKATSSYESSVATGHAADGNKSESPNSSWADQVDDQVAAVQALKIHIPKSEATGSVVPTPISASTVDPQAASDLFFDVLASYV